MSSQQWLLLKRGQKRTLVKVAVSVPIEVQNTGDARIVDCLLRTLTGIEWIQSEPRQQAMDGRTGEVELSKSFGA